MNLRHIHLAEVDSTNTYARQKDDETNFVVTADYQSCGRGQGECTWESEAGRNLLLSIKVSPRNVLATKQFVLSMAGALSVKASLDTYVDEFLVKWPNDIYFHESKISGTLIETSIVGKYVQDFILGIGVNVNQRSFLSAPNPVSLWNIRHEETDLEELLARVLKHFDSFYQKVENGEYDEIYDMYNDSLFRRQELHSYEDKNGLFEAQIQHVEPNGHIVLQDKKGTLRSYELKELKFII